MKPDDEIRAFLELNFECEIHEGNWGDPFPFCTWLGEPDWIFSWLCPWKLPKILLNLAKKGAINFHPGPPKYPGVGCYNYAIWNEDLDYGVTVHFMDEKLDHGYIIEVVWLIDSLKENITIKILKNMAITELKRLFYKTMNKILNGEKIQKTGTLAKWGVYKSRKAFQKFCEINFEGNIVMNEYNFNDIDYKDLELKLRATYFKGARDLPHIIINGKKWCLIPEEDL